MASKKKPVKRPRRKPGTGGVRHLKGNRALPYETEFTLASGDTRRDYFSTAEAAAAHLDGLVAARDSTTAPRNVEKGSQIVTDYLSSWLVMKEPRVDAKTLQDYKYQCDLAAGKIGRERLDSVDLMLADTMLAALAKEGYKNVAHLRMVMRQAFEYAEDNHYITHNPFRKATAPRMRHRKAIGLTEAQRAALLAMAAQEEPGMPLEPLWHLTSRLAFRRGEALGLRWIDIDWEHAIITVAQQRTTVGTQTITKDSVKGDTDGTKIRHVPAPLDILDLLRAFRLAQMKRQLADGAWEDTGLIFVGEHGIPPAAITVNRRLKNLVTRVNNATPDTLPTGLHPHDLRHTALYLLALAGTPANVRKALSGHSTARMDEHYTSHATVEDLRKALG
jgi:integrase